MYQPYYNPYMQQNQMQTASQVVRVNGENGARAYQMPPNSSVLLLDENDPLVWLKTTDGAGYPTVTPYTIAPYHPDPAPDFSSLEARIKKLEEVLNGKSNPSGSESQQ